MRVVLGDASVFSCGDESTYRSLRRLLEVAAEERHWCDPFDPDVVLASDFARQMMGGQSDRELLQRVLGQAMFAATAGDSVVTEVVYDAPPRRHERGFQVPARDVGEWASQPLKVLMENQSDAILLKLAVAARRRESDSIPDALQNGHIVVAGCGGTGELAKAAENCRPVDRVLVVCDSDRDAWTDPPAKKPESIKVHCDGAHIPVHCLRGREKENYFPLWSLQITERRDQRPAKVSARAAKKALMYQGLADHVIRDRTRWDKNFGAEQVDTVLGELKKKSKTPLPLRSLRDRIAEIKALSGEERMVADLKAQLGEPFLAKVEMELAEFLESRSLEAEAFSAQQRDDLDGLCALLERWL